VEGTERIPWDAGPDAFFDANQVSPKIFKTGCFKM
jgi:hypothetical protein